LSTGRNELRGTRLYDEERAFLMRDSRLTQCLRMVEMGGHKGSEKSEFGLYISGCDICEDSGFLTPFKKIKNLFLILYHPCSPVTTETLYN
jgi:hypothetical protein